MVGQAQGAVGGVSVEGMPAWQLARRQRIVEAALHALQQQDYEQIQIREVAQAADVALGTLYRYFSSKEHLYAAVLEEWASGGLAVGPDSRRGSAARNVRSRIHGVIRSFERHPQFYKVLLLLQGTADSNAKALMGEFADNALQALTRDFDVLGEERAKDAAIMMWSIISTMMTYAVYHGTPMPEVYRIADRFVDLLALDQGERGPGSA
jgi:AcrR family transcriptional regulator